MSEAHHSIKSVVRLTGLSAHVIRIWEKRYAAVQPNRTETNRRMYSLEHIERLTLLVGLTQAGHSIGAVAILPTEKLRELTDETGSLAGQGAKSSSQSSVSEGLLEECLAAVKSLDSSVLEDALIRGETELGAQGLLRRLIAPLAIAIGDLWREGMITAAHEHFATSIIRVFLSRPAKTFAKAEGAPVLVVATPSGQLHELGGLLVGASAANLGWHITYLGASLPAAEIAGAARQNRARAVALSLVYPEDDTRMEGELTRLRQFLPPDVALLVGGRAMISYREALDLVGAIQVSDLESLSSTLDELRRPKNTVTLEGAV
jgi:DNA-binding transcriptional MerR regulator/methylmalonyl-CoA mutase cobalamin-binding subunit